MAEYEFGFKRKTDINPKAVSGEKGTGYQDGKHGPFECGNCKFYDGKSCGQSDMVSKSTQPKVKGGRIKVHEQDHCAYFDGKGEAEAKDESTTDKDKD